MELPRSEMLKLPTNVMCGDHSSFNKHEPNVKDPLPAMDSDIDRSKEKLPFGNITPTTSLSERTAVVTSHRTVSEHTLRVMKARRRVRSLETVQRAEDAATPNRALIQAALGSFRWPPYLLGIWVLVLLLTHILHCAVSVLDRTLPAIRHFCEYFRSWTEREWQADSTHKMRPICLALVTSALYTVYFGLYVSHGVCLWCMEPLCGDAVDDKLSASDVTEHDDSKTNCAAKQ